MAHILHRSPYVKDHYCKLKHPIYTWNDLHVKVASLSRFPPVTIDIFRHGQSVTNYRRLITGRWDVQLSELGLRQAQKLATSARAEYDVLYTSSLTRSMETLTSMFLKRRAKIGRCCRDDRLDERSLGKLEGKKERYIREFAIGDLTYAPRGGESYLQVTQRVLSFLVDVFEESKKHGKPQTILVSTHMGPLRIIVGILENIPSPVHVLSMRFDNSSIMTFKVNHLEWPAFLRGEEGVDELPSDQSKAHPSV